MSQRTKKQQQLKHTKLIKLSIEPIVSSLDNYHSSVCLNDYMCAYVAVIVVSFSTLLFHFVLIVCYCVLFVRFISGTVCIPFNVIVSKRIFTNVRLCIVLFGCLSLTVHMLQAYIYIW